MLKLKRAIVFFDLETTGLDTEKDRIVQFAAIRIEPDGGQAIMVHVINPGIPIPQEASDVHGYTDEMVRDKPGIMELAGSIHEFFQEADIAGYNITRFDVPLLWNELKRCGYDLDMKGVNCLDVSENFFKKEPRDLDGASRFYLGKKTENLHDALIDVQTTMAVLNAQIDRYDDLPEDPAEIIATVRDPNAIDLAGKLVRTERGITLTFGKYKGILLDRVDSSYLAWLLANHVIGPDAEHIIREAAGISGDTNRRMR